jgi:DTW domain-containing protein YfiP
MILQHRRERFHPFNTARIVHQSLSRSQLIVDRPINMPRRLQLQPGSALLFPLEPARLLSEVPEAERPKQLVILDGTWHQAKVIMRDIPALHTLPRFRLSPCAPSRYRIRREPTETSLSTVEAIVAALQILEPDTAGTERLLEAFDFMIDSQLKHPGSANGARFSKRRSATASYIPQALSSRLDNVIVAYGESAPGERGKKRIDEPPVSWVAQRLGDGEVFSQTIIPPRPLDDTFLTHAGLTYADFASALPLDEARRRWNTFQRPKDVVVVFQPGTARLLAFLAGAATPCLVLKSVGWKALAERLANDGLFLSQEQSAFSSMGRAGKRLAETVYFVRRLNSLANQ